MLGLDVCEAGGQLLELLWLALCYRDIMADKEGVTLSLEEEEEDADVALAYKTPEKKSLQEIQELDPGDESLRKYKQALLGAIPAAVDASVPNVQVTRLTLMCEQAPGPITMDLTGDLEELRGQAFVLKEGVDYRVKVSFKVNREIVCGLRCLHLTYRRGRPGEWGWGLGAGAGGVPRLLQPHSPVPPVPSWPSGSRRVHGGQLRAAGRGVRGGDPGGGGAAGMAGEGLLPRPLPRHRRRQDGAPLLGVGPVHKEGLGGLSPPQPGSPRQPGDAAPPSRGAPAGTAAPAPVASRVEGGSLASESPCSWSSQPKLFLIALFF
uniref:Rho GDP dissociation inhibitor gamma n=1 Tax=Taeniopygia guttata TaxID=59729 RepID=A0A674HHH1_TAEGU